MEAQQLFKADGTFSGVYWCSNCGLVNRDESFVNECCLCRFCGRLLDRDKEYTGCHKECWHANQAVRSAELLEKAQLVEVSPEPFVYTESGWGRDGFIEADLLVDVISENVESPDDWPEFVFCTKEHPFPTCEVSELVERCAESMYEDACDDIEVPQSLRDGLAEFNSINSKLKSYDPDYTRKIRVPSMPAELFAD